MLESEKVFTVTRMGVHARQNTQQIRGEATPVQKQHYKEVEKDSSAKCFHGFRVQSSDGSLCQPKFEFQTLVGQGSYGKVYRALCERGCAVAIKSLKPEYKYLEREIRNLNHLSKCSHPNIIEYFGHFNGLGECHLVFELGDENFDGFLDKKAFFLANEHLNNIMFQTLEMLSYLNDMKVYHADFRFFNMVYCRSSDLIKLIDFGNSKMHTDDDYSDPLRDLAPLGYQVAELQVTMKYKAYNQEWSSARREFICAKDVNSLLSKDGNWLIGIPNHLKRIIALCSANNPDDRGSVLGMRVNLAPRKRLDAL